MIARWLTVNIITVIMIVLWSLYRGYDTNVILIGKLIAQAAFILFLVNVNMYFVFLFIRKSKNRNAKIKLAKISKRMMKYHISIALSATLLIVIHAGVMIVSHSDILWQSKTASGIAAITILPILLFSGLLRRWKASGKRRKFHYTMAFIFIAFVFFHIFI